MKRWVLILAAVAVIFLVYPLLSPSVGGLDETQAKAFVLEDIKPLLNQGVEARFVNAEKQDGKWAIDALLTRNAHSTCPSVEKRFYTLFPIGFRSENVVDSCGPKVDVNYREEALIQSAKLVRVSPGSYGCAFFGKEYKKPEAKAYCSSLDEASLDALTEGLTEEAWLVQWTPWPKVALTKNGHLLKAQ